jgi:hypothetical protein
VCKSIAQVADPVKHGASGRLRKPPRVADEAMPQCSIDCEGEKYNTAKKYRLFRLKLLPEKKAPDFANDP